MVAVYVQVHAVVRAGKGGADVMGLEKGLEGNCSADEKRVAPKTSRQG